jgi:N-methylhydantoinase B/oxoprolinase/acetone carboxylase alpha subunit
VLELRWKVLLRRFGVRRGSGGEGAHRGGDGIVRELELLEPVRGGMLSERRVRGAFGIAGGEEGAPGRNVVVRDGVQTELPGRTELDLRPGDVLRIETPGGGGYGVRTASGGR